MYKSLYTAATLAIASAAKYKVDPNYISTNIAADFADAAIISFDAPQPTDGSEVVSYNVRVSATGHEEVWETKCFSSPCAVPMTLQDFT